MRFKHTRPENSSQRIVTKFLWLPRTINDETRWLETTSWLETCTHYTDHNNQDAGWEWIAEKWMSDKTTP